jgi:ABC-type uncharacterized transport system fused permease/ATPase subunit
LIYYVPQKPYNPYGTLRDQITYPEKNLKNISNEELRELLYKIKLKKKGFLLILKRL